MSSTLDFEARLRRDLTELAGIPSGAGRVVRLERRRRPITTMALATAVVLVLLAAGVGVARLSDHTTGAPRPMPPVGSGPALTTTSPASSTSTAAPSTAAPSTTAVPTTTLAGVSLRSVQWSSIGYPLSCGDRVQPTFTVQQVAFPTPAVGAQLAVVLVRCNSDAGSPSSSLYVYDGATSSTSPHLSATLVTEPDNWQTSDFTAAGSILTMPVDGFSSERVPRCCPDVQTTLTWTWIGAGYSPEGSPPPHVTLPG